MSFTDNLQAVDDQRRPACRSGCKGTSTPVAGYYSYQLNTVNFRPAAPFAKGTTYEVAVTSGVKDLAGNGGHALGRHVPNRELRHPPATMVRSISTRACSFSSMASRSRRSRAQGRRDTGGATARAPRCADQCRRIGIELARAAGQHGDRIRGVGACQLQQWARGRVGAGPAPGEERVGAADVLDGIERPQQCRDRDDVAAGSAGWSAASGPRQSWRKSAVV